MSHKSSKISLRKQLVSADKNTTFLAHYDITANDVLKGVAPLGNVSTLRPIEGYYGGGIAIEEGTTNRYPGPAEKGAYLISVYDGDYGFGALTNSQWSIDNSFQPIESLDVQKISRINSGVSQSFYVMWTDFIARGGAIFAPNEERTVSFYYFGTYGKSVNPYMSTAGNITLHSDKATGGNGTTSIVLPVEENKWQRITFKMKNNDATNSTFNWGWMILHSNTITATLDNTHFWKFTGVQVESKAFDTSFVNGTRAGGILDYGDISQFIPTDQYTVMMWVNGSNGSYGVSQDWNMCFSVSPAFYMGWDARNSLVVSVCDSTRAQRTVTYTGQTFNSNQWYMIGYTFKNGLIKMYVDGKKVSEGTITQSISYNRTDSETRNLYIGNYYGSTIFQMNGIVDESRIDKIERTEEEIESWYISQLPFYPKGIYRLAY